MQELPSVSLAIAGSGAVYHAVASHFASVVEFPAELGSRRLLRDEGNVVATFVVDTNGRVIDGTAHIVSESNRGFGQSVCTFLRRARFRTAAVNGRKLTVAVLAAPFMFSFGRLADPSGELVRR